MSIVVTIEHSIEELNAILVALAERPFKEVAALISKLQSHGQAALAASGAADPAPAADPATPEAA